jgi:hypothetical protein
MGANVLNYTYWSTDMLLMVRIVVLRSNEGGSSNLYVEVAGLLSRSQSIV